MPKTKCSDPAYVAGTIANNATVCRQFARFLGGDVIASDDNSCTVMRARPELSITILGRPYAAMAMFEYQSPDTGGITLNTGEVPMRQREVNPFIDSLRDDDILVTTIQTHWLFDRPRLVSVHFEAVRDPLAFAQAVAGAITTLTAATGRADDDDGD